MNRKTGYRLDLAIAWRESLTGSSRSEAKILDSRCVMEYAAYQSVATMSRSLSLSVMYRAIEVMLVQFCVDIVRTLMVLMPQRVLSPAVQPYGADT